MDIHFLEFQDEIDLLIDFLTADTWNFHAVPNPSPESIREKYEDEGYTGEDCKTFWLIADGGIRVGLLRLYDLQDTIPVFDIRILSRYRGMGIGETAVRWLVDYLFCTLPDADRIESYTRQDNYAMRCVFRKCGFLKEAHHRNAWPGQDGMRYDSIGYGITKEDWESGGITPVNWNDFRC